MRIETGLTRLVGIDVPIVQAGMSWASSNAALPLAVSRAGGLGVIAAGPMREADLVAAIEAVRGGTGRPFGVNLPLYRKGAEGVVALLLERPVPVLIASQGGPTRYLERFRSVGTVWLHVVASVEHAVKAAEAGVDGLVVVGGEAGGHPPAALVSTLVMVRAVARALPGMPLVASGGFADGAGLAAALALGAGAVQFGTRFLASEEAGVDEGYKQAVVRAETEDTRTVGVGLGMIRALANRFTERMGALERSGAGEAERGAVFGAATLRAAAEGDVAEGKVEAGQSAGLIDDVAPAGVLVERIAAEYVAAVAGLPGARPGSTASGAAGREARAGREGAALRRNLQRRKVQSRLREGAHEHVKCDED